MSLTNTGYPQDDLSRPMTHAQTVSAVGHHVRVIDSSPDAEQYVLAHIERARDALTLLDRRSAVQVARNALRTADQALTLLDSAEDVHA